MWHSLFLALQAGKRREDSPKHCSQAARLVWTSSEFGLEEEEERGSGCGVKFGAACMSETETALRTLCAAQLSGRRKLSGGNPNNTMMVVLPGSTSDENMICVPSSRRQCESTTPPSKSSAAAVEAPADPVSSTEVEYITSEDLKDMNDIDVHLQVSILNPHSSYSLSSKVRVVVVAAAAAAAVVVVVGFMPCHTSKLLVICEIGIQSLQHESVCMQLTCPIAEAIMVVFPG